jgi:phosphotransferase system  glucose/maltose/N-acetylglucosamine-specific IIC component
MHGIDTRHRSTAMSSFEIVRYVHVALGTLALVTFWSAGLARKGSPLHRASGKVYLAAMAVLLLAAVPLTVRVGMAGRTALAAFLGYLLLITGTACWKAWRAIRDKRDWARYAGGTFRALAGANLAGGAAILGLGVLQQQPIFMGFSLVGLLGGRAMLRFARQPPADPRWWLDEHLGATIGNGVATHIAFLAIGLPRLWPALSGSTGQMLAWLGPLVLATIARFWLARRYLPPRPRAVQAAHAASTV